MRYSTGIFSRDHSLTWGGYRGIEGGIEKGEKVGRREEGDERRETHVDMIKWWKTLNRLSSPGSYSLCCAIYSYSTQAWPHAVQAPKHLSGPGSCAL